VLFGDREVDASSQISRLETFIILDKKLIFTLASYFLVLAMYINLQVLRSFVLGFMASIFYFLINGMFLGHAFFEQEAAFFRLTFGILLLIMLLEFIGWLSVIIYNLDVVRFTLVLFVVATLSSFLNRKAISKNVT